MSCNSVAAIILAAGSSRRFGTADKRCARLTDGRQLLRATYDLIADNFAPVYVVLGMTDELSKLGLPPTTQVIRAPRAEQGQGASLADAFVTLGNNKSLVHIDAVAVCLGDMPYIKPTTLTTLQMAATAEFTPQEGLPTKNVALTSRIIFPQHCHPPANVRCGHPVIFGRNFWPELEQVSGDEGGRKIIQRHLAHCQEIVVDDGAIYRDIDTPADID